MNKVSYTSNQAEDTSIYFKKFDIKCPHLESKNTRSSQLAAYNIAFSDDSRFILIYFRPKAIDKLGQIDLKDGIYLLWDIQINSSVSVKLWGSPDHRLDQIIFPHHISGHYQFMRDMINNELNGRLNMMPEIPDLIHRYRRIT